MVKLYFNEYIENRKGNGLGVKFTKKCTKFFTFGLLLFSLNFSSYADPSVLQERVEQSASYTSTTSVETMTQEVKGVDKKVDINWMDGFLEIDEATLKDKILESPVASATVHSTSTNLYVVLENGEKYKVLEASSDLISYLRILGLKISSLTFTEKVDSTEANPQENLGYTVFMYCALGACGFGLLYHYGFKKKEKAVVGEVVVGTDNERASVPPVKFSDVEGVEELKSDVFRIVDCLKNPDKYREIGARIPKGVILYGPPGTGKTLLAKAIAGEAGVPFISVVGSDFVEKYVGVGASRVRDIYKKARKSAPCIVFIDEVDAVAGQRGNCDNTERDQTINALLAELDGFKDSDTVVTICATNRLDMLDSAFKRAGRFDLKLAVGLPDKKGRRNILEIHTKNKRLSEEVDLDVIANKTTGFSGAELEALMNESALSAVGKGKQFIDNSDIDDAYFKIVMQGNKKKRDSISEVNRVVAWHEAGHTLATKLLTDDSVSSVTIVGSSSGAGGVTFRQPKEDNILHSKKYLESLVKVMYAGRAAEEIYFNDKESITTGASQDIKQATSIIKEYLSLYGMGEMGMLDLGQFRNDYQDVISEAVEMSKRLYIETLDLLKNNKIILENLSNELLVRETLEEREIDAIINHIK